MYLFIHGVALTTSSHSTNVLRIFLISIELFCLKNKMMSLSNRAKNS